MTNYTKHKVFISYYHYDDQYYKEQIVKYFADEIFIDMSVNTGDIDDNLSDERIRQIIRDDYLRDSTVTIVLVGPNTKHRKHVDWEIHSSMFDGSKNKKSGILVINLPEVNGGQISFCDDDKEVLGADSTWTEITNYDRYWSAPNLRSNFNVSKF